MKSIKVISLILPLFWIEMGFAGIYEPQALWTKRHIKACFYDPSILNWVELETDIKLEKLSSAEEIRIREIINANFSQAETGVEFIGWQPCATDQDIDVIFAKSSNLKSRGQASIGNTHKFSSVKYEAVTQNRVSYVAIRDINPFVVAHEAGHVLGLYHESENEQSNNDPNCRLVYYNGVVQRRFSYSWARESTLDRTKSAVIYTSYDPVSVMNRCNPDASFTSDRWDYANKVLSYLDKLTLKYLYSALSN